VKLCQEGTLRTPCHKVITKVPNDEVKKASTAVSSMKIVVMGCNDLNRVDMAVALALGYLPNMGKNRETNV
jgi:hypothetical protein